ncbi:hypothetical protein L2E82_37306 [Cichorium intybus]|uniref:Uncharacterized protein n=1 Tax=Cichorium intybus TaxID=13427 RepID=A0ACB9AEL2_CICIN|nr:hypothetical protein L2E82_37306 [Cichorium intybus]
MEEMANSINKQTPKTQFIRFNIFSIIIFISIFSFTVSLCSYIHHFSSFDKHYIFLICNGILVFLIMNFDSTHDSSPKENQSVTTNQINHPPVQISPTIEEQYQEEENEEDDGSDRNGSWVCVTEDDNVVSVVEDQVEDQQAEIHFIVDEQETEELNKRCAEFIRKMKQRIKSE